VSGEKSLQEDSQGTYEAIAFMHNGPPVSRHEAFFHDFCVELKARQALRRAKLVVTGGVRSLAAMNSLLSSQLADLIGLGRPFCFMPDLCPLLLQAYTTPITR